MLTIISEDGRAYKAKPFKSELYKKFENDVSQFDKDVIEDFIVSSIEECSRFSVATRFPNPWPEALGFLYIFAKNNDEQAALLLGNMVQLIAIKSETQWVCTKTDINKRNLDTNFYWKSDS